MLGRFVEEWLEEKNIEIGYWEGSGDFGDAYNTECGKIIKITSSMDEFVNTYNLLGKENEYLVDIYDMAIVDGNMIIVMEKLDTSIINENAFYELQNLANELGTYIYDVDFDDLPDNEMFDESFIDEMKNISNSIYCALHEGSKKEYITNDIRIENIGRKKNGNIALFDQISRMEKSYIEKEFLKISLILGERKNQENKNNRKISIK